MYVAGLRIDRRAAHTAASPTNTREREREKQTLQRQRGLHSRTADGEVMCCLRDSSEHTFSFGLCHRRGAAALLHVPSSRVQSALTAEIQQTFPHIDRCDGRGRPGLRGDRLGGRSILEDQLAGLVYVCVVSVC